MRLANRYYGLILLATTTALASSGCGVRQFNDRFLSKKKNSPALTKNYGPMWASGQRGDVGMGVPTADNGPAPGCDGASGCPAGLLNGCCSCSTRPCARGRFSAGLPTQMDSNNYADTQGGVTGFSGPVGPAHATVAGPGRTLSTSGPNAPNLPQIEQRDMSLMRKGAAPGEQTF